MILLVGPLLLHEFDHTIPFFLDTLYLEVKLFLYLTLFIWLSISFLIHGRAEYAILS